MTRHGRSLIKIGVLVRKRDLKLCNLLENKMVPGLGFIGRRLGGGKKTRADATAQSDAPEGVLMVNSAKGLNKAPTGIYDSVHSLHTMDREEPSVRPKPSPPPSPTSTLPDVSFLDLNGSDSKSSEPSSMHPDEEPTMTPDDPEWQWHEPALEVDPKDAATPDRFVHDCLQHAYVYNYYCF